MSTSQSVVNNKILLCICMPSYSANTIILGTKFLIVEYRSIFQSKFNQAILLVGFASCCSWSASENFLTFCVGTKQHNNFKQKKRKAKESTSVCLSIGLQSRWTKKWNEYTKEHFVMCIIYSILQCLLPSKCTPSPKGKSFANGLHYMSNQNFSSQQCLC